MLRRSRPSIKELRQLYLLVGECLELGADPVLWRRHLATGMQALIGDGVALIAELSPDRLGGGRLAQHTVDVGWQDTAAKASFDAYSREDNPEQNPLLSRSLAPSHNLITLTASQTASEPHWQRLAVFEYMHEARLHYDCLASVSQHTGGVANLFVIHPRIGEKPFPVRSKRLLWMLHRELYPYLGGRLAMLGEPTVTDLPQRAVDVLINLLRGDSIKQVAGHCGISTHTATDYAKSIYRHLNVNSRGELIARYGGVVEMLAVKRAGTTNVMGTGS